MKIRIFVFILGFALATAYALPTFSEDVSQAFNADELKETESDFAPKRG